MLDLAETKRRVEASSRSLATMSAKLREAYDEIESQRQVLADVTRRSSELESLLHQLLDAVESQRSEFVSDETAESPLNTLSEALIDVSESTDDDDWSDLESGDSKGDGLPRFKKVMTSS